ncbi:MAG: hypothetical protein ACWGQW_14355, partial [bacterium]
MFKNLIESSSRGGSRSKRSLFVSGAAHAALVILLIVIPLIHYETLPALITYIRPPLVPPPPFPPSPAAALPSAVEIRQVVEIPNSDFVEPP